MNKNKIIFILLLVLTFVVGGLQILMIFLANKESSTIFVNKNNLIVVENPRSGQTISTPLAISGRARGMWFFEASFPIVLQDSNGKIIAEDHATALGEWMTEDFVPFEALIEFEKPETKTGILILKKDNPSGLPEHEDKIEIKVTF